MAVVVPSSDKFSAALKQKAIKMYMENGNLSMTARVLDVPFNTMQHWRYRTSWWPELQKRFQEEADRKTASKMDKLVGKAITQIEDRIDNGEQILDSKSGEVITIPLKARDLTNTVKVLSDRTDVLLGRAAKDSIAKEMMEDKLAKLAKEFASFSKQAKLVEGEVIDNDTQDIVEQSEEEDALESILEGLEGDET